MDFAKYWNLFQYLKKGVYPERFTRQDKTTLRKFAKKFACDSKIESLLFYVAKEKDCTALRRLVITEEEKARVFKECHSAPFTGHAGGDNTLRKIKERFYWPGYYKDTMHPLACARLSNSIVGSKAKIRRARVSLSPLSRSLEQANHNYVFSCFFVCFFLLFSLVVYYS